MTKFVLGSQSPRRRALFGLLGVPFSVLVADADEESVVDLDPGVNVVQTAVLKTNILAQLINPNEHTILITADTTVALGQTMLGKPKDVAEAKEMLLALRGRDHAVYTGTVLFDNQSGEVLTLVDRSVVTMRSYDDAEIDAYIATGDPMDKAGAYAIQHPVFRPVAQLNGCFAGVMGLPVCQLVGVFQQWGLRHEVDLTAVSQAHAAYPCSMLTHLLANFLC